MKERYYQLSYKELLLDSLVEMQSFPKLDQPAQKRKKNKSTSKAYELLTEYQYLVGVLSPEKEALLTQTLSFKVRKKLLSEAGLKGAMERARRRGIKLAQPAESAMPISSEALTQPKRPLLSKLKGLVRWISVGVLSVNTILGALSPEGTIFAQPKVESISPKVDEVTLKRAAKVGEYLPLSDELAYQGTQRATKFLSKHIDDIDPSIKEAARLNNQFYLENLANTLTPEQTPQQFDEALSRDDVQEYLIKNAYEEVLLWETAGPPEYSHRMPRNLNDFLSYLGFRMKGLKKNLVTVMVSLVTERGSYSPDIALDLLEIASVIGDIGNLDFEPSKIQEILAKYYENPIGGKPVLRNIALNCLTAA